MTEKKQASNAYVAVSPITCRRIVVSSCY